MLSCKKTTFVLIGIIAVTLLAFFSGCDNSTAKPKVTIEIAGAPPYLFYSLSVFEPGATVTSAPPGGMSTRLSGWTAETFAQGTASFSFSDFPAGNYVLVLGGSNSLTGEGGKMYITGTAGPDTRKPVAVNFSTPIPFSEFLTNGGAGYEATEIVSEFGTP